MMRLSVSGNGGRLAAGLRRYIDRRMHFALGRFTPVIDRVAIRLADVNGPRGGVDKHCRIVVKLQAHHGNTITVDDYDENQYAVIARASARVARAVGRAFERRRARRIYRRQHVFVED